MMKRFLLLFAFLVFPTLSQAQTALGLGDIAFTGYQSDDGLQGDVFSFVLLKDVTLGTTISFTDRGWLAAGGFRANEGTLLWVANLGGLAANTEVTITVDGSILTSSSGSVSVSVSGFALSTTGDQIFAYQGLDPTAGDQSNFIAAIQMNGAWDADATSSNTSAQPTVFTDGNTSISIAPEVDNGVYNCSTVSGNAATLRAAIHTATNWTVNDVTPPSLPAGCSFNVVPVELVYVRAVANDNAVTLSWATASERNNAGFEVQALREETFTTLGFVDGHGTTLEAQRYAYAVRDLAPGTHVFRLKQIDFDGRFEYSPEVEVEVGLAETFRLSDAYPNPFNPRAAFDLVVQQDQHVTVGLYNLLGQQVATLFDGTLEAGSVQTVTIDGADLPSGVYLYRAGGETFTATRQVTLLK